MASEQTNGALAIVEYDIPPRTLVAPLHTHAREDEYSYVVRGMVGTQIGDETITADVGQLLVKRRGNPHTLWNPSEELARILELIVPGGFERCLETLQRPDASRRYSAPADLERLGAEYGIEMHPESVATLMREHRLRATAVG